MTESQKAALIEEFMPEAVRIALEMSDGSVPIEDLTQEAYVGLLMSRRIHLTPCRSHRPWRR